MTPFDVASIRKDFPLLQQKSHGKPLVYLDSGATAQKPQAVIDVVNYYYSNDNANAHRGVYALSERATACYEATRQKVKEFINAKHLHEIIFTRGTTDAINLVAASFGLLKIKAGDEIIISAMEHHSNIVPWQLLCQQTGAVLKVAPIDDTATLIYDELKALLGERTKLVAVGQVSNAFGSINPVEQIVRDAHAVGALVLVDGAQGLPHEVVDVQALDVDFYAFSGHKVYGPTGVGALYGKQALLDAMPPWQGGGEMIKVVSFTDTQYNTLPHKFEAGTPGIVQTIGLGVALDYLMDLGMENVAAHEADLAKYASERLTGLNWLGLQGTTPDKAAIFSFTMDGAAHAHDISTILDKKGVAVRAGHHCAQPLMQHMGVSATCRASFGLYNTREEVDTLVEALELAHNLLG